MHLYLEESGAHRSDISGSNRVYQQLASRPLYYVWQMRKDLVETRKALNDVLHVQAGFISYRGNQEAEKLERASKALGPSARYSRTLSEALDRSPPPQSGATGHLYAGLSIADSLGYFIGCKLARIMGRQGL